MLDEFVELMYAYYQSELDMSTFLPCENMIEHRIYKPGSNFEEWMAVYIHTSNQTKGFYVDLFVSNKTERNINVYNAPNIIKEWSNLFN